MKKGAFTLIELLIVVVIIGVLVIIAIPQYQKVVKKAIFQEAISNLGFFRKAQLAYEVETQTYVSIDPRWSSDIKAQKFALLGMENLDNKNFKYGGGNKVDVPGASFFISEHYVDAKYCPNNAPSDQAEGWVGLGIEQGDLWCSLDGKTLTGP